MSYPQFGYSYPAAASSLASTQLLMNATAAAGSAGVSSVTSAGTSCCENGRPIMTDPHTGQTVCSCQYSPSLLTYPRVTGLSDSVYNSATAAYAAQGYMNAFGTPDPSAFYSPLNYDLAKESGETWRSLPQPTACYPYDPTMAAYPYGASYGMDLNGAARRKNATRETTSTLKAWLYEHRKNPYPTKGEKIMLAIITKMTLTQVSTWFANARRRLKKENKMTWSPRNRCGEDKDDLDSDGDDDDKDNSNHSNQDREEDDGNKSDILVSDGEQEKDGTTNQETLNKSSSTLSPSQEGTVQGNINGERPSNQPSMNCSFSSQSNATQSSQNTNKPRIWSIAQVATSSDNHSSNIVGDRSSSPGLSQSVNFSQHALSVPGQTLSATPTRTLHWGIGGAYTVAGMTRPGVTHPYYSPGRGLTSSHQATAVLSNNQVETPPNTPPSLAKKYPTGGFLNTPALPYSAFSAKIPNGSGINNHEVKTSEAFLHSDATKTAFKPVTKSKFNDLVKA